MAILRDEVKDPKGELNGERDVRQRLEVELSALRQQLQDHIKHTELSDTRRWALIVALIVALLGAALSLASGLIVSLSRK